MSVNCVNESPGGGGGVLPEKLSISDQNLWFSLPYFRPEMIGLLRDLSPNDEEVDSSKKYTQFKNRVRKPYRI